MNNVLGGSAQLADLQRCYSSLSSSRRRAASALQFGPSSSCRQAASARQFEPSTPYRFRVLTMSPRSEHLNHAYGV